MKPLFIEALSFVNFKNYTDANFSLGPRFNLVYGLNGAGKTNLLDGVYYISIGKSFFTPFDQKSVAYGKDFFRIECRLHKGDQPHEIIVKVRPGISKELSVDGHPVNRISDHLGFIPIVISAPKDIDLVLGSSQSRRRYMDHLLCQLDHEYLDRLVYYNHMLQMRSATLKQEFKDLRRMIQTIDEQMAPAAKFIFEKRAWLVSKILPLLESNYKTLSDGREQVSVTYESGMNFHPYEVLADMHWELDKNTQRSNAGIHKDDFRLFVKDMPAKEYASQGQIKSTIFALHLGKYRILHEQLGFRPLLILDDIFDKLDESRLRRLMEILVNGEFGQIFLSDTNRKRVGDFVPPDLVNEIEM